MEALLRNDFTSHYGIPVSTTADISQSTTERYFEIEDIGIHVLHFVEGRGMAAFKNDSGAQIGIVDYDKFVSGLDHQWQRHKKRCDAVVYTSGSSRHFLLAELKDQNPNGKFRRDAKGQLLGSLPVLLQVPSLRTFINTFESKKCCIFNKQAKTPETINATTAFNRINTLSDEGLQLSYPQIEVYGFELYEYSGGKVFSLN